MYFKKLLNLIIFILFFKPIGRLLQTLSPEYQDRFPKVPQS